MKSIISYNEHEVKTDGSLDDLENGYNVWIDLEDPDHGELLTSGIKLNLDADALETYSNKSKKPEIRVLENHTFTVMLDRKTRIQKHLKQREFTCFLENAGYLLYIHQKSKLKKSSKGFSR